MKWKADNKATAGQHVKMLCTARCTTCCPTQPRQIEAVEFGRQLSANASHTTYSLRRSRPHHARGLDSCAAWRSVARNHSAGVGRKLLAYCVLRSTQPSTLSGTGTESLSSSSSWRIPLFAWTAPRYLADDVTPAIEVASRHQLRSANRHRLIVPRCRLNTYGRPGLFRSLVRRSGTHCSQMNSEIRRVMSTASNSSLKQSCSAVTNMTSALEVIFNVMRSINPRFTYLLTEPTWSARDCISDDARC